MKIGIDLRFIKDDIYSKFVLDLVDGLLKKQIGNEYIIYGNGIGLNNNSENIKIKNVNIQIGTLSEQTKFYKILKKDKNDLMIFFNHYKPIFYKKEYITLIGTLKDIYYMNFDSILTKGKFLFLLGKNLKKSHKLICLEENTKNELIEKFDIEESRIYVMDGFFPKNKLFSKYNENDLDINVKSKYGIINDFFIYSGGDSIEKNYEKLILAFSKLKSEGKKIDIVFLGHNISTNLNLRKIILDHKMQKNIHFLGLINEKEKKHLYNEALGTIFPSFYEPFPFRLGEPIYCNSPIIASDLKSIKNIFGDKIFYFSPISANSLYESINDFLINAKKDNNIDYLDILSKYNRENTLNGLLEIIK